MNENGDAAILFAIRNIEHIRSAERSHRIMRTDLKSENRSVSVQHLRERDMLEIGMDRDKISGLFQGFLRCDIGNNPVLILRGIRDKFNAVTNAVQKSDSSELLREGTPERSSRNVPCTSSAFANIVFRLSAIMPSLPVQLPFCHTLSSISRASQAASYCVIQ